MQVVDIIVGVLLLVGLFAGLKEGFVKQICALVGLVAGVLVGKALYMSIAERLQPFLHMSEHTVQIVAFVLILIVVPLVFSLVAWLISKVLKSVGLAFLNRILGAVVGVLKYALVAGLLITAIEMFDSNEIILSQEKKAESIFYYPLNSLSNVFFKEMKGKIDEWTDDDADDDNTSKTAV